MLWCDPVNREFKCYFSYMPSEMKTLVYGRLAQESQSSTVIPQKESSPATQIFINAISIVM